MFVVYMVPALSYIIKIISIQLIWHGNQRNGLECDQLGMAWEQFKTLTEHTHGGLCRDECMHGGSDDLVWVEFQHQ